MFATFITPPAALLARTVAAALARACAILGRQFNLGSLAQAVHAVGDDQLAGLNAGFDDGRVVFGRPRFDVAQGDGAVFLDHVNKQAARAALKGGARHGGHLGARIDQHAHVDELVRKQPGVVVGKLRFQFHGTGSRIDLVVDGQQNAGGELHLLVPIERVDRHALARLYAFQHDLQIVLRNGVNDRDRLQLRDDDQPGGVARPHNVAHVDLAQAQPARYRRRHARISQLEARVVDQPLIDLDGALVLTHQRILRVDELLRDRILRQQHAVAVEVDARIGQQRLVARHLPFILGECGLERPRVDFRQQLAFAHELPLAEHHAHQLAVDAASDRDGFQRRDRAEPGQVNIDVLFRGGLRNHWHDARCRVATALFARRRLRVFRLPRIDVITCTCRHQYQEQQPVPL